MSHAAPQIMILDEPTNHLDVDARENLVRAINAYEGAVILISHDRHLVELCADRLWLVADGTVQPFDGDLEDYANQVLAKRRNERKAQESPETGKVNRREDRKARAEARQAQTHLRKKVKRALERVEKLTNEKAAVEAQLADPTVYEGRKADLAGLMKTQSDIADALSRAESEWLEAEQALEQAESLAADSA
jgi:ATP-binding cassette subfamily F protein 3